MKPSIFSYSDYRTFFKDFYKWAKKSNPTFSHRYFAKKAGFSSSNLLYLIIEGKRRLTKDFVPGFSSAIGLSKKEQNYLDALVSFNHAKTPEAKRYYLELLHNMMDAKIGKTLAGDMFEYYSKWYYPIIRELVLVKDFCERPEWIKSKLFNKINCQAAKDAIEALLRLEFLSRDENGRLVQAEPAIATEDDACHELAYVFHDQMLILAREILVSCNHDKREFSGLTMAVSKTRLSHIKEMMRDFNNKLMRFLESPDESPETVVQLNMQMFPVTKMFGLILAVLLFASACTNGISKIGNPTPPIVIENPSGGAPDGGGVVEDLSNVTKDILVENPDWSGGCFVAKFLTESALVEIECDGNKESGEYVVGTDGSLVAKTDGKEVKIIVGSLSEEDGGYLLIIKITTLDGTVLAVLDKFNPVAVKELMQDTITKNGGIIISNHSDVLGDTNPLN